MKLRLLILILLLIDGAMIYCESITLFRVWHSSGLATLRFYTQSSNLWALMGCSLCAIAEIMCLANGQALPDWTRLIRFVFTACLMVTMIVAACILAPMDKNATFHQFMLEGHLLYLHTVCPLMMLLSCLLHAGAPLNARHALIAIIPTAIYAAILLTLNIRRIYSGPYFFFKVYEQPIYMSILWCIVILGGNFLIAWLLTRAQGVLGQLFIR